MELIQLCRNDGDSAFEDYGFVNVPGKRFGSLMQQQARTNTFLKTVSVTSNLIFISIQVQIAI